MNSRDVYKHNASQMARPQFKVYVLRYVEHDFTVPGTC